MSFQPSTPKLHVCAVKSLGSTFESVFKFMCFSIKICNALVWMEADLPGIEMYAFSNKMQRVNHHSTEQEYHFLLYRCCQIFRTVRLIRRKKTQSPGDKERFRLYIAQLQDSSALGVLEAFMEEAPQVKKFLHRHC